MLLSGEAILDILASYRGIGHCKYDRNLGDFQDIWYYQFLLFNVSFITKPHLRFKIFQCRNIFTNRAKLPKHQNALNGDYETLLNYC